MPWGVVARDSEETMLLQYWCYAILVHMCAIPLRCRLCMVEILACCILTNTIKQLVSLLFGDTELWLGS